MIPDQIRNLSDNPCLERKPIMKTCPDCDGDGERLSDCCGASIIGNGDNDSEDYCICPQCHDYCSFTACSTCEGTGDITLTDEEIQDLKDHAAEWIYENNKSENHEAK